jgi:hypothetical protein
MIRSALATTLAALVLTSACARAPSGRVPARPTPQPNQPAIPQPGDAAARPEGQDSAAGPGRAGGGPPAPRPYARVITAAAITKSGMFNVHRVGERLYFEIPQRELGREILVVQRTAAGGSTSGFFGGGGDRVVYFQRVGNRVLLRQKSFGIRADSGTAIHRAVDALNYGPIIAALNVEAFGPDSALVVDVSRLFTSNITEFAGVTQVQADRSFVETFAAFPENINVEATQTGTQTPPGPPGGGGGGGPAARAQTVTARVSWSFYKLPETPMRPRLHDRRVGIGSISYLDYSRPEHEATTRRFIRRFRLENAQAANGDGLSDPIKPIVFWIDPATPEWLVPWVKRGVESWEHAYREAGFTNAIMAKEAPARAEDPEWSMHDARHSMIYWRPSSVANATGGQIVDPRTGEILKAEVNMYHNVMNLLRNWYFIQAAPLDVRAQKLPLPDSLMGRLVEYVVTHEVGHAIGFPHNMKASSQYPVDSLRSVTFLRRMGGHVATLMDYSRFNYVAQPEDSLPTELLIPRVGPYDRYAIMWQNRPIPGARTPDEEWPTLDQWSRMQDTIPWFRWSTTDATADPGDLTEAVGDADAVRASTLAMKNLRRVMGMLLTVAERPGEDYTVLSDLYGDAVSQWRTYNNHVAAIVGGAESQERYGTGPRFTPLSEARQRDALRYLAEHAFAVPAMFTDPEILRRIEQEGVISRIRGAQAGVLNSLLSVNRLNRLIEYEALAGPRGNSYTVAEFLDDMRRGVWTELTQPNPRVDVFRRNLQRAYIEAAERTLIPPPTPAPTGPVQIIPGGAALARSTSDARALLRGELAELQRTVRVALARTGDGMTRLHLRDIDLEIERILDTRRR